MFDKSFKAGNAYVIFKVCRLLSMQLLGEGKT